MVFGVMARAVEYNENDAVRIHPVSYTHLQTSDEYLKPGGRIYEQRECIYNALKDIPGVSVVKPKAAFYIFPKIDTEKFNIKDDEQFALDFLKHKKILVTHGRGFHWEQPDHFRMVYLCLLYTSHADFVFAPRKI